MGEPRLTDLIGDIVALRILVQRLFALVAFGTGQNNAFLEAQRTELLSILPLWNISGNEADADIKARAEVCINEVFDQMRVTPPPAGQ